VIAKDSGCKVGNVSQIGMGILCQHGLCPLSLELSSQSAGDCPNPLNDQDDATTKTIAVGHCGAPAATNSLLNHVPVHLFRVEIFIALQQLKLRRERTEGHGQHT